MKLNGLKYVDAFKPASPFRYEAPVSLGKVEVQPGVTVGSDSYIVSGFIRKGVVIGRFCSIGREVTIGTGHHDINSISTSPFFKSKVSTLKLADKNKRIRVLIGNDVWIGDKAVIMSGVTIGHGAVIAAGSIVTKDVPSYSIFAGVPAKFIRDRFSIEVQEKLLDIKWWEFQRDLLKDIDGADLPKAIEYLSSLSDDKRRKEKFIKI